MVHLYKHIIKHLVQRTVCIFIFIFKQGRHTIIKSERMADEAAPRPNQGFVVRKLVAVNPTFDTVKTFPQGIIELALRGAAVVWRMNICVHFCIITFNSRSTHLDLIIWM